MAKLNKRFIACLLASAVNFHSERPILFRGTRVALRLYMRKKARQSRRQERVFSVAETFSLLKMGRPSMVSSA